MKETLSRRPSATLEDLIRNRIQKPPKEMIEGVTRTRNIINEFNLVRALGINSTDSVLLHAYLAERVLRTKIYDFDWITHSPEFDFTQKDRETDEKARKRLQDSLDGLILQENEMIGISYDNPRLRLRARNLELAANDLIARSSVFDEETLTTQIVTSDELIEGWAQKWSSKFKQKIGHARQKNLYYLKGR